MKNQLTDGHIFALPTNGNHASQVSRAIMLSGLFFVLMMLLVYHRFVEPHTHMSMKEFFTLFSGIYILIFVLSSARAAGTSSALRKRLCKSLPRDVVVVAPEAANSGVTEIIERGRKYWFWQLVCGFLTGVAFSWLGCLFLLFVY